MCVALMSIFDTLYMDKNRDNYTLLKLQHFRITEIASNTYQTGVPATRRPQTPQGVLSPVRHDSLPKNVENSIGEAGLQTLGRKRHRRRRVNDGEPQPRGRPVQIVVIEKH